MSNTPSLSEKQEKQLAELAEKCNRARGVLRLGNTTLMPKNYDQEKERFFKSKKYNPVFHYKHLDFSKASSIILHLDKQLSKLDLPDDIATQAEKYIDDLMLLYKTKSSIGTYNFTDNFERLLGWDKYKSLNTPSTDHINTRPTERQGKFYTAKDIRIEFLKVLEKRYGIRTLDVVVDPYTANIISSGYKSLTIGSRIKRHKNNVKRLIVHEIESHALQTYNMRSAPAYADLTPFAESVINAEGLAVYNEIETGTITDTALNSYRLRFESAKMINKSFREIFDFLVEHMNPEKAYIATFRMKRGISDTALPGGNPKDAVYLLGYHVIQQHMKNSNSRKDIYRTKSIELTRLLKKYNLLRDQKLILPKFL